MKLVKFKFGALVYSIAVLMLILPSTEASAMTSSQLENFSQNNILFYDPNDNCAESYQSTYVEEADSYGALSSLQVRFIEEYHDIAVVNSINYGIPWEAVMAQGILESTAGTSDFAIERNNFFGIAAFDSNPNGAYYYDTPAEGWEGYYKNIQVTETYRNNGVFAGDTVTDPYAYLQAIKKAGYASDPDYVKNVGAVVDEIIAYAKEKGWPSSAELAEVHPEWYENAENNRQGAETSSNSSVTAVGVCTSNGSGAGSGELVSGGMTLEEAEAFMAAYRERAMTRGDWGDVYFQDALISVPSDGACVNGTMNNCSAFTQWFLNKYTTLGPNGVGLRQGSQAVSQYLSEYSGLIDGGKVPRVYAVMSEGPFSGTSGDGWYNHTAIVLGIDEANDQIIFGEASCGGYYYPQAKAYSLSEYTNSSSSYGPTYAYTDNVLKGL